MTGKEETMVPATGFLPYRYVSLTAWTAAGVVSAVWMLPLARGDDFVPILVVFLSWTLLVLVIAAACSAWVPLHTRSLRYVFEADRLVAHSGVWYHSKVFVPYARITDITVRQGPLERRFALARVSVQTAGSSVPEAVLLGVGDPDRVREILLQRRPVGDNTSGDGPVGAPAA